MEAGSSIIIGDIVSEIIIGDMISETSIAYVYAFLIRMMKKLLLYLFSIQISR